MKVGDKIRFLNSEGGGIVTRIMKNGLVAVEDPDGFEIPTPESECIVIESTAMKPSQQKEGERNIKSFFAQAGGSSSASNTPISQAEEKQPEKPRTVVMETKEGECISVQLAFVPQDIKKLNQTTIDVYLVNDSNYYLSALLMQTQSAKASTLFQGEIAPHSKMWVEELSMEELNDWAELHVQVLAYKLEKVFGYRPPYAVKIKNDLVRFYKLHSYIDTEYFAEEKALLLPVIMGDEAAESIHIDPQQLTEALRSKEATDINSVRTKKAKKEQTNSDIVEVDLHINELLDNVNGLTNADILSYQLETFHATMQEHMRTKGQKLVFIHGKGEGVLRKALIEELRMKYKTCLYQDASFKEYGFGATLVIIK